MITYIDALGLARDYLEESEIPLEIVYEESFLKAGFCYQSKEYLDTGKVLRSLQGMPRL